MKDQFEKGEIFEVLINNDDFKMGDSYIGICPLTIALRKLFPEPNYYMVVGASWVEIMVKDNEGLKSQLFEIISPYPPNEIDKMIKQAKEGTWNVTYKVTLRKLKDIYPKDLREELLNLEGV